MKRSLLLSVVLVLIFFSGLFLRTIALPDNLLFGYEQGRDALVIKDMFVSHHFTLLGPKTDIDGIFHGVGYYYLLALLYALANFDPARVIFLFCIGNALTCIIVYFLAKEIIGKTRYALLSSVMAAISFDIIIYGRWLSNVSFSIPLVALFFYSLTKLVKTKNANYWLLVALTGGLLSHFELLHILYALAIVLVAIPLFLLPVKNRQFFMGIGLFILTNASFIVFDLRHDFLVAKSIVHYITAQSLSGDPLGLLYQYIQFLVINMTSSIFPANGILIFLFVSALVFLYMRGKKENFQSFQLILLLIFFSFPYVFLLKYGLLNHFFAGTAIGWILLFNFLMSKSEKHFSKYALFGIYGLLIISNVMFVVRHLTDRTNIFYHAVQQNYIYKDQLATMDYIFSHADTGFTIESFNIPYYHQQAWQYLYDWYGKKNYPAQYARNASSEGNAKVYIIIEPGTQGKVLTYWLNKNFSQNTILLNTVKIGEITVEERQKNSPLF